MPTHWQLLTSPVGRWLLWVAAAAVVLVVRAIGPVEGEAGEDWGDCFTIEEQFRRCCCSHDEVLERVCWQTLESTANVALSWRLCCSNVEWKCSPTPEELDVAHRAADESAVQQQRRYLVTDAVDPGLECNLPGSEPYLQLKWLVIQAVEEEHEEPSEQLLTALQLLPHGEPEKVRRVFMESAQEGAWPFDRTCLFGLVTELYVEAWRQSVLGGSEPGTISYVYAVLFVASKHLRANNHDLIAHTSWPITSWDITANMAAVQAGLPFRLKQPRVSVAIRFPSVWPSPLVVDALSESFAQRGEEAKPLVIWLTAKHPGSLYDIYELLKDLNEAGSVKLDVRSHMISEYCEYPFLAEICSQSDKLKELMRLEVFSKLKSVQECGEERGQWCGLQDLHRDFDQVTTDFERSFGPEYDGNVDVYICGHPLFWCRLFERFRRPPGVVGVWDMSPNFVVPAELQADWTARVKDMFTRPENLLVSLCLSHTMQAHWLLGMRVPYFQLLGLKAAKEGRYSGLRSHEVLVSVFHTPWEAIGIKRIADKARASGSFPFDLVQWQEIPGCGRTCSKQVLANYRAVVLDAYDTANLKLMEFYGMAMPSFIQRGELWRTTMRWARAQTVPGDDATTDLGRRPEADRAARSAAANAPESIAQIVERELLVARDSSMEDLLNSKNRRQQPFSPYLSSARPDAPSQAYWSHYTDWSLMPHLIAYEGIADLLGQLLWYSLDDLKDVSGKMDRHYRHLHHVTAAWWQDVIFSVGVSKDSSLWFQKA